MIRFQFFPRSQGITKPIQDVISCFEMEIEKIKSTDFNLSSNEVLETVRPHLEKINFTCETGKSRDSKISVPVLFGFIQSYFKPSAILYLSKFQAVTKAFNPAISMDGSTPAPQRMRPSSCWSWT